MFRYDLVTVLVVAKVILELVTKIAMKMGISMDEVSPFLNLNFHAEPFQTDLASFPVSRTEAVSVPSFASRLSFLPLLLHHHYHHRPFFIRCIMHIVHSPRWHVERSEPSPPGHGRHARRLRGADRAEVLRAVRRCRASSKAPPGRRSAG